MKINGSRALLECLKREGVDTIFGYPGGAVIPIYDMIYQFPDIRHILVRHEQGAGHMAEGYALATGKVGVCLATSGPGATNLVTPIADAMMDSVPLVAITGQVKTSAIGTDAFQEADITGITMPITKHNWLVKDVTKLPEIIAEAFHIARSGRPGPVLIDIPVDISRAEFEYTPIEEVNIPTYKPTTRGHSRQIQRAAELIAEAQRPVLYVGGGAIYSGAQEEVRALAERTDTPVTTTLKGLGAFPETHSLSLGMLGMHGTAYSNYAVSECDLLIAVGARFDDRVTGKADEWVPTAKIIHIDVDPAEIGKVLAADVPIVGDVQAVLAELLKIVAPIQHPEWNARVGQWKQDYPLHFPADGVLHGQYVIEQIGAVSDHEAIVVTDVGQHQMWEAQYFKHETPRSLITSGGLGTMGFALPAAIGAKFACPEKDVWVIAGDGGFQMTASELSTIMKEHLAINIAVINNGFLGMVRQWQETFYDKNYSASPILSPDFVMLAAAHGIEGTTVGDRPQVTPTVTRARTGGKPFLINFQVEKEDGVYPMIAPGAALHEMVRRPSKNPLLETAEDA